MIRAGRPDDALAISALATYVFFDTYCTAGLRDDLAREAFGVYRQTAFAQRLSDERTRFLLATHEDALLGFAEIALSTRCPAGDPRVDAEVVRLYVHPRMQGRRIGSLLLSESERLCAAEGAHGLWLSAWVGNARALAFYAARGLERVGSVDHVIEGTAYENHVLVRRFGGTIGAAKQESET